MARPKSDIQKHTLNLRTGDFDKMGEMFPAYGPSRAIRELISRFVDKHYTEADVSDAPAEDIEIL